MAGEAAAVERGVDLVHGAALPEFYVPAEDWPDLSSRLQIRSGVREPNLVVRLPRVVWPFADGQVGLAALAANLLESGDPRAVEAGMSALRSLARDLGWR
ncbi:hypothetical protein [Phycicoccus sonneratiae]|uniref:hypothetical protein n=1 Tax=Phycicoccus sonneratiae TaxID=2807628 RepID=UPI001EF19A35|nr:hypothetical protein [Phycicoccus sonneraticus]